jgi:phosphoesterase RecJ-like protein
VLAGITVKQTGDREFKISLRTFEPLDGAAICGSLGGGGHKAAAGVTLEGTLEEVKAKILAAVGEGMEKANVWSSADK